MPNESLTDWKESGAYFDHAGHRIFYRESSRTGEVLLCMHGFPTSSFDFRKIWDALSAGFALSRLT